MDPKTPKYEVNLIGIPAIFLGNFFIGGMGFSDDAAFLFMVLWSTFAWAMCISVSFEESND